jgi:hypothetical protein
MGLVMQATMPCEPRGAWWYSSMRQHNILVSPCIHRVSLCSSTTLCDLQAHMRLATQCAPPVPLVQKHVFMCDDCSKVETNYVLSS